MTIGELKLRLKKYILPNRIRQIIRETRSTRKWYDKNFENNYIKRRLYAILKNYEERNKQNDN